MAESKTEPRKEKAAQPIKSERVKVKLPKENKDDTDLYVSVNGESFLIKRGVVVEVPEYVAEVIRHSEDMNEFALAYIEKKSND